LQETPKLSTPYLSPLYFKEKKAKHMQSSNFNIKKEKIKGEVWRFPKKRAVFVGFYSGGIPSFGSFLFLFVSARVRAIFCQTSSF